MSQHPFANKQFHQAVYLGAGSGESLVELANTLDAKQWLAVEGDEHTSNALQAYLNANKLNRVTVQQTAVSPQGGSASWYRYNSSEFNGLQQATGLKELFPGLKQLDSEPVDTQAIGSVLNVDGLSTNNNLLVIDIPGYATELLTELSDSKLLGHYSHVIITETADGLFKQAEGTVALEETLEQNCFDIIKQNTDDPDFPVLFARASVMKKQLQSLQQQLEQANKGQAEKESRVEALSEELEQFKERLSEKTEQANQAQEKIDGLEATVKQADEEKQAHIKQLQSLQQQLEQANKGQAEKESRVEALSEELEQFKERLSEKTEQANQAEEEKQSVANERDQQKEWHIRHKQRTEELQHQVNELQVENQSLKQTVETLNKTFTDNQSQLLQKVDKLMNSQERQTKRIESSIGVSQFWQTGDYTSLDQQPNLGPQLKEFLLKKLSYERYNVVIQFGASDTVLFIAKVLNKLKSTQHHITPTTDNTSLDFKSRATSGKEVNTTGVENYHGNDTAHYADDSLPAEVCVFDNSASKLKELEQQLNSAQLSHLVTTKHAPLVDYTHQGQDYLHYDSDSELHQLKELLQGRGAKILVLASGPSTSMGDYNRFPAAPKVLNALSPHEIHFVTDDYHDKNAKDVAIMWSKLFDQRELSVEKHIIADDKPGFAWLLNQ